MAHTGPHLSQRRRVTVYCFYCGKKFERTVGHVARVQYNFCSRECAFAARREGLVWVRSGQSRQPHNVTGRLTGREKAAIAAEYGMTWAQLEAIRAQGLTVRQWRKQLHNTGGAA